MNVTDVRVTKLNDGGKCKGLASITINEFFAVTNIRIMEGQNGLFIAMPSRKLQDGTYKDVCFPVTAAAREEIRSAILDKYDDGEKENNDFGFGSPDDLPF